MILVFIGGGFVPTDTMPDALGVFAEFRGEEGEPGDTRVEQPTAARKLVKF